MILKELLEAIVYEVPLMNIDHKLLELVGVVVNRFEKLEESFDDLSVGLTEGFIKFNCLHAALDSLVIGILIFKVFKIEENVLVLF